MAKEKALYSGITMTPLCESKSFNSQLYKCDNTQRTNKKNSKCSSFQIIRI